MRLLLVAGILAAVGVGLTVRTVFREALEAPSEDVRADSARAVGPPAPPPGVTGWYPGANVPVAPDTAPRWESSVAAESVAQSREVVPSTTIPATAAGDGPGDPGEGMVGIAPSAPLQRAPVNRRRASTEDDDLRARGGASPTPGPATERAAESRLSVAQSRLDSARARLEQARAQRSRATDEDHEEHLRQAIAQAADDVEDAEEDAASAARRLAEARRRN